VTFLTPIPAIIAAAISVPALLVLYFLKLRRRPVRVSSTLLWVQATRDLQVNVPLRWLRMTWLLLLQLLILGLLLLAMARPAIGLSGRSAGRVIVLMDRSASMAAHDMERGRSRLVIAQDRAVAFLSELSRGTGGSAVSIVAFDAEPAILAPFSEDRGATEEGVRSITPTDQPGDLGAALRLASAMLAGDTDESRARRPGLVVLFSDGSFAGDTGFSLAGAEFRYERVGPARSADGAAPAIDNLGIVGIAARRDRDDPGSVRLFVRIQNAAPRPVAAPLVLTLDGKEIERRPIVIPPAAATPAQGAATFSLRSRDGGLVQVRIDRPDVLDADNTAAVVLDPQTKPRIIVVTPDPAPDVPRTSWVITNILDELELPYRMLPASAWSQGDATGAGGRVDLVIFDGVEPRSLPAAPTLSFGAGLPMPGLSSPPPASRAGYFISWRRTHPVLRDLSLDNVYVGRAVALPEASAIPGAAEAVELARGAAGPMMLALAEGPRIIVAFDPADSNWPLSAGFPVFVAGAIDYLTMRAEASSGRMFTTAEPAELAVPARAAAIVLDGPTRISVDLSHRAEGSWVVGLGRLERAGIYRVEGAPATDPPSSKAVAVNLLDETESAAAVIDSIRVGGDSVVASAEDSGPRELWPWLVLAALILLSIEWFLNAWLMRT
jgi:von Willebrand factor type A domain/Aerotolerance regulator N-terminal